MEWQNFPIIGGLFRKPSPTPETQPITKVETEEEKRIRLSQPNIAGRWVNTVQRPAVGRPSSSSAQPGGRLEGARAVGKVTGTLQGDRHPAG